MIRWLLRAWWRHEINGIYRRWRELHGDAAETLVEVAKDARMTPREMLTWYLDGLVYCNREAERERRAELAQTAQSIADNINAADDGNGYKASAKEGTLLIMPPDTPPLQQAIIAKTVQTDKPTPRQAPTPQPLFQPNVDTKKLVATLKALGMPATEAKERAKQAYEDNPDGDMTALIAAATKDDNE